MKLSLAGWSLQSLFRAAENPLKLVDFAAFTRDRFGIEAIELNSPFFVSRESGYLRELVTAAERAGVTMLNIAVDEKGDLSSEDEAVRQEGLANYSRWIAVAKEIGCAAIRANSGGKEIKDRATAESRCIDSFRRLTDEGRKHGVVILMENHWGLSMDPGSMVRVIEAVRQSHGEEATGTLADYGNWPDDVDRYDSLKRILPYAKAVHAKVNDIDENLNHPRFDHARCIELTRAAGYDGYLGIEYEGSIEPVEAIRRGVRKLTPLL